MKPFLSIIIPVYNESKRLPLTLVDMDRHLSQAEYSYEIIVVDDGSTDGTGEIVSRFSRTIKNLRLTGYKENHGKGYAVRFGMLEAKGNYRIFMDADNSTSIDQFDNMLPFLKEGYEVVIGSRDVKGAKLIPPQPWYKRLVGNIGNIIIQILLLPGMWDSQCGFKCFSEAAAEKIFSLSRINRWAFDVEALSLAKEMGYRIKEIPVTWVNNVESRVKPLAYVRVLWDVVRIRIWLWRNVYRLQKNA
ncbi:MAG: dolichyl-phosphate beta-glucosyltransferase [Minisyncoccia bacterium]